MTTDQRGSADGVLTGGDRALGSCDIVPRDRFVIGTTYTLSRDAADPNAAGNPADAPVWTVGATA